MPSLSHFMSLDMSLMLNWDFTFVNSSKDIQIDRFWSEPVGLSASSQHQNIHGGQATHAISFETKAKQCDKCVKGIFPAMVTGYLAFATIPFCK